MDATHASQFNQSPPSASSPEELCRKVIRTCEARDQRARRLTKPFGRPTGFLVLLSVIAMIGGCGGDSEKVAGTATPEVAETAPAASQPVQLQPTEVVSQLLDRVRRGGKDGNSSELLTKLAQQELTRIGRPFEFPGSPDTVFQVGQTLQIPDQKDMVWVQTYLSEPSETGQGVQYEVVWTLRRETAGWRVSGFVIDQGEGMDPLEFDFENGDEMAARLAELEQGEQAVNR